MAQNRKCNRKIRSDFLSVLFSYSDEMHLISLLKIILMLHICTQPADVISIDDRWKDFKTRFRKNYKSSSEEASRFDIFKENCVRFEEHNRSFRDGNVTFSQGINRDADLTNEEVFKKYEGEPL